MGKIIKKYKKWTGSRALGQRFNDEVLSNPNSLVRRDFGPLLSQYQDLSINLQSSTPAGSEPPSLTSSRRPSRRPSTQIAVQQLPQHNSMEYVFAKVKKPMESAKAWFSPSTSPGERHSLLVERNDGYFAEQQSVVDTDLEDEAYASSNNEFPAGYMAHYATFPSINEQKFSRHREMLLFRGMVGAYAGSLSSALRREPHQTPSSAANQVRKE